MSQSFENSTPDSSMATTTDAKQRSPRMSARVRPMNSPRETTPHEEGELPIPIVSFPRIVRQATAHQHTSRPLTSRPAPESPPPTPIADSRGIHSASGESRGVESRGVESRSVESRSVESPNPASQRVGSHVAAREREGMETYTNRTRGIPVEYGLPEDRNDYTTVTPDLAASHTPSSNSTREPLHAVEPIRAVQHDPSVVDRADEMWQKRQKLIYEVLFQITLTAVLITILLIVHAWLTGKLFAPSPAAAEPGQRAPQVDGSLQDPLSSAAPSFSTPQVYPDRLIGDATDSATFPVRQANHEHLEQADPSTSSAAPSNGGYPSGLFDGGATTR